MRNALLYLFLYFPGHFCYSDCMLSFCLSMSCSCHYAIIVIVPSLTLPSLVSFTYLNLLAISPYINQLVGLAFALECIIYELLLDHYIFFNHLNVSINLRKIF